MLKPTESVPVTMQTVVQVLLTLFTTSIIDVRLLDNFATYNF
jgi:hypothetical protein